MHRENLLEMVERYLGRYPEDRVRADHVRQFVRVHEDCFERTCLEGHVTGSAWILSPDHQSVLLTHHRKLGRWLQLGGHSDGDPDPFRVALREACEESGLTEFDCPGEAPEPFDIDVHTIPARKDEPAHLHHDIRFLLIACPGQELQISDESIDLAWIPRAELSRYSDEESLLRLERKTDALLVGID